MLIIGIIALIVITLTILSYLKIRHKQASEQYPECLHSDPPCDMSTPIDAVLPWVDTKCPIWKRCRQMFTKGTTNYTPSYELKRYGDGDVGQLEVCLAVTSLLKYAPWLNKIHILTHQGQVPDFIKDLSRADKKKVNVIHHPEFFIHKAHLPTFNSTAIECNIYNLKGVSERFIYLNDDMYLSKPVSPNMFFSGNIPIIRGHPIPNVSEYKIIHWFYNKYHNDSIIHMDNVGHLSKYGNDIFIWRYEHMICPLTMTMLNPCITHAPLVGNKSRMSEDSPPIHRAVLIALKNGYAKRYKVGGCRGNYKSKYVDVWGDTPVKKLRDCHEICCNQALTTNDMFEIRKFCFGY